MEKEILDPASGGRMFYFDKQDPRVLFGDNRVFSGTLCDGRTFQCEPDEVVDFRDLPYKDGVFKLVIFDPPHLRRVGDKSWMKAKYGQLPPDGWKEYLKLGFDECWRCLSPGGVMIFKWNEHQISIGRIKDIFPDKPIMGTRTKTETLFIVFFKSSIQNESTRID